MPRRGSSLGRADYVVGSGVANTVGGSHVLFRRRDPFSLVELAILALDVVALFLVSTVPFAGDLTGELTTAEPEGERDCECDCAEENRKSNSDDLRRDAKLLKRHE